MAGRAGPAPLVKATTTIRSQSVTSVRSIAQVATVAALNGPQGYASRFRKAFEERRGFAVDGLALPPPEGAFYACIGVVLADDTAVASHFLGDGRVAGVPGAACRLSPCFRISTAASESVLSEATARLNDAVAQVE